MIAGAIGWIIFGILSAVVAKNKNRNGCGWFIIGFFLGPFGFILALIVRKIEPEPVVEITKKCPYCASDIRIEAIVCKYCGRDLPH